MVFRPENKEVFQLAGSLGNEYVVAVVGKVAERPAGTQNKNLATGDIEVEVDPMGLQILTHPSLSTAGASFRELTGGTVDPGLRRDDNVIRPDRGSVTLRLPLARPHRAA